jgi:hypothetical protein
MYNIRIIIISDDFNISYETTVVVEKQNVFLCVCVRACVYVVARAQACACERAALIIQHSTSHHIVICGLSGSIIFFDIIS